VLVVAKVVIHHGQAQLTATRFARKKVEAALRDVEINAKIRASHGPYATGYLASTITKHVYTTPLGVRGRVGSDLSYAGVAERGARAHIIRPRVAKALHFYWRRVGHTVTLAKVNHPGMEGKGYLRESLIQAGRRHNLRVVIRYS